MSELERLEKRHAELTEALAKATTEDEQKSLVAQLSTVSIKLEHQRYIRSEDLTPFQRATVFLDEEQFTLQESAEIVGLTYDQLRQWITRGQFTPKDPGEPVRGRRKMLRGIDVIQLAFVKLLTDLNQPLRAYRLLSWHVELRAVRVIGQVADGADYTLILYPIPEQDDWGILGITDQSPTAEQEEILKGRHGVIYIALDDMILDIYQRLIARTEDSGNTQGREMTLEDLVSKSDRHPDDEEADNADDSSNS